jgi:3-deoxy-manno-octulosonate cytidylyltransferase (CMP-KDO synthetase)
MTAPSLLIVIPARYASTRFPGKPLADICGKPMIQHVYERCLLTRPDARTLVATDDARIELAVREFGGEVMMTPVELASGSERAAWIARDIKTDIIVNVQGDEPLLPAETLEAAITALTRTPAIDIGTAACLMTDEAAAHDANVVKVVTDSQGNALYFSRSAIPRYRAGMVNKPSWLRHVGVYAFRRHALLHFASLPTGALEIAESLEQLRALEYGMHIGVGLTSAISLSVDTPEDLARIVAMMD